MHSAHSHASARTQQQCSHVPRTRIRPHACPPHDSYISFLEIYNEAGFDLLDAAHDEGGAAAVEDLKKVVIMEDESGNMHLKGLSMNLANSAEEALNLLFVGDTNRAMSATVMNANSSRSHCIFTVSVESRRAGTEVIRRSKLNLVDLAGSERTHKTGATGQLLRESKHVVPCFSGCPVFLFSLCCSCALASFGVAFLAASGPSNFLSRNPPLPA
jgi:hypothetical protein